MALSTLTETNWNAPKTAALSLPETEKTKRIQAALGVTNGHLPKVDQDTLARYYEFLSANLPLPFAAWYPQPMNSREKSDFRCTVVELLDPSKYLGDEYDGIFCTIRKDGFEVNLPLIELHVPQGSLHFQLIEDYWYWFWNWR